MLYLEMHEESGKRRMGNLINFPIMNVFNYHPGKRIVCLLDSVDGDLEKVLSLPTQPLIVGLRLRAKVWSRGIKFQLLPFNLVPLSREQVELDFAKAA